MDCARDGAEMWTVSGKGYEPGVSLGRSCYRRRLMSSLTFDVLTTYGGTAVQQYSSTAVGVWCGGSGITSRWAAMGGEYKGGKRAG